MGCSESRVSERKNLSRLPKPQIFFVLGGPGSGKGTQCDRLVENYGFKHISVGDLLREEKEKGGPEAEELANFMKEGKLVSSDLVMRLMKKKVAIQGCCRYLIDGFPRNEQNLQTFRKTIKDTVEVVKLIFFNCSLKVMEERIMERAKTSGRVDDNPESIKKRLELYEKETIPVIQKFKSKGGCIEVNAQNNIEDVYQDLVKKLDEANIHPPQTASIVVLNNVNSKKFAAPLIKDYGYIYIQSQKLAKDLNNSGITLSQSIEQFAQQNKALPPKLYVEGIKKKLQRYCYEGSYIIDNFPKTDEDLKLWNSTIGKWANFSHYFIIGDEGSSEANKIQQQVQQFLNKEAKLVKFSESVEFQQKMKGINEELALMNPSKFERIGEISFVVNGNEELVRKEVKQDLHYIELKEILQEEVSQSGLYANLIEPHLQDRKLQNIPNEITVRLIKRAFIRKNDGKKIVLKGFPTNTQQFEKWFQMVASQIEINNIFHFTFGEKKLKEIYERIPNSENRLDYYKNVTQPFMEKVPTKLLLTINVEPEKVEKSEREISQRAIEATS